MATITVMKNFVMKKAQGSSDENLKKIAKILKNYSKLDVATKKRVSIATEKLYTDLKAKESKSSVPKKSASASKKSGTKKKIATQDLKSILAKFKAKVGTKLWKQATTGTTIKQDAERPALPKGKRFSKVTGKPYWENRANRSDVKQPPKSFPKLAKGGDVDEGREKRWLLIFEDEEGYAVKSSVIARTEKEAEEEARYQEELGDDWKLDSIHSTGYYAKGGEVAQSEWVVNFSSEQGDYKTKYVKARSVSEAINKGFMEISEDGEDSDNYSVDAVYKRKNKYSKDGGYKLVEYAKGGITEHGLKVGDKIKSGKVIGTTILVEDSNGEYARVDLNKGIRTKVEWDSKTKKYIDKK